MDRNMLNITSDAEISSESLKQMLIQQLEKKFDFMTDIKLRGPYGDMQHLLNMRQRSEPSMTDQGCAEN